MKSKKFSWEDAVCLLFLTLTVLLFFWRIWIPDPADRARFKAGDFTHVFFPARYYAVSHLAKGRLPLWNPFIFCGYPHFADPQAATFYPITWLTAFLTDGNLSVEALQWEAIFHFFLAAFFTYFFALYLTENRKSSLLAAVSFTFGGYLTGYPPLQLSLLESNVWLPAALLTATLAIDRSSSLWAGLSGLSLAMVFLAGRPQAFLVIILLTLAWFLYRALVKRIALREAFKLAAIMLLFCLGFGAVQVFPTLELIRLSARSIISWEHVSEGGFAWWELMGALLPHVVGSFALYPGLVAIVLAAYAIWKRQGLFWFWVALLSLFFSLGKNFAIFPIFYLIQKFFFPGYVRNPERAALTFVFAIAMLASIGFASLEEDNGKFRRALGRLALTFFAIWLLASLAGKAFPFQSPHYRWLLDSLAYNSLLLLAVWGTFELVGKVPRYPLLLAFLLLDLFTINMERALEPARGVQPPFDVVEKFKPLQSISGIFRVDGNETGFSDFGIFLGLENTSGTAPIQIAWQRSILAEMEELTRLKLMNVHVLATKRDITHGAFKLLYEQEGFKFYAFFGFNPRAYLVTEVRKAQSDQEIVSILNSPDFNPGSMAVVSPSFPDLPKVPLKENERVEILKRSETFIALRARAEVPRLLVYVESFYPGWRAEVDGHPTAIYKVNGAFRGIIVPEGEHEIVFRYQPISLYLGASLTLGTFAGFAVLSALSFRKRKLV